MSIRDPNKLLADLVKNNRIGKGSSKDVQIVARHGNKNSVRVKYSQKIPGTSSPAQGLKLTEATKTELAKTRRIFPKIVNDNAAILFALDVEEEMHHPAPRVGVLDAEALMPPALQSRSPAMPMRPMVSQYAPARARMDQPMESVRDVRRSGIPKAEVERIKRWTLKIGQCVKV